MTRDNSPEMVAELDRSEGDAVPMPAAKGWIKGGLR